MSAPPLPEIFGNYALKDFAELVPPDSISWLPQTPGWAWLGLAVLVLALRYLWRRLKHWYSNRYRREAIIRLRALAGTEESTAFVSDVNRILKITALVAYSRTAVAKLSGQDWVNFLNQQCPQAPFDPQQMQLLATAVYGGSSGNDQRPQLLAASLAWVAQHQTAQLVARRHA